MATPALEILDSADTSIGVLTLRRRELLGQPGTTVTEVTIDHHDMLMSSQHTESERALASSGLAMHAGSKLRVLVGGLGLGYTAAEVLADSRVESLCVADPMVVVHRWLRDGLLPLSETLNGDARMALSERDIYSDLLAPPAQACGIYDVILIDVDHSPTELLHPSSAPFYTVEGQRCVAKHLAPAGVLAVWSAGDDDAFAAVMDAAHASSERKRVLWNFELIDEGEEIEDVIFLARTRADGDGPAPGRQPG